MPRLPLSLSLLLFGLVTQRQLFPVREKTVRYVTRPCNGCDYAHCLSSNRDKIKSIRLRNIISRTFFYAKQTETLLYLQYTQTEDILRSRISEDTLNKRKGIIFQRGPLEWLLPIWTLPSVYEIRDKMQVVYQELTRNWVKSKVAKSEFYL